MTRSKLVVRRDHKVILFEVDGVLGTAIRLKLWPAFASRGEPDLGHRQVPCTDLGGDSRTSSTANNGDGGIGFVKLSPVFGWNQGKTNGDGLSAPVVWRHMFAPVPPGKRQIGTSLRPGFCGRSLAQPARPPQPVCRKFSFQYASPVVTCQLRQITVSKLNHRGWWNAGLRATHQAQTRSDDSPKVAMASCRRRRYRA